MKIITLLITVLFVVIVKGQLYEFVNGCRPVEDFDGELGIDYIDNSRIEINFSETYNSLSLDFIRQPLPKGVGFFIISASLLDNFGYRKSPLSLTFTSFQTKTLVHITFSKFQFNNNNGWSYAANDYYYNYYGTILEIRYLICDSYKLLQRFNIYLTVGYPLNPADKYKLIAELSNN